MGLFFFKCMLFLHSINLQLSAHSHIKWPRPVRTPPVCPQTVFKVHLSLTPLPPLPETRVRRRKEFIAVSSLKLAVAADGDVRSGGSRSSALVLRATVAGLRAAQVARGARQQVGVMAAVLMGAVR